MVCISKRRGSACLSLSVLAGLMGPCGAGSAQAQQVVDAAPAPAAADSAPQDFALHGQVTVTAQQATGFASPYTGTNSFLPNQLRETVDATLYFGVRPWQGAELWLNPEVDQGFGVSNTLGVAGFVSGEAYKVGKAAPYVRLQRAFLRQTVQLGGAVQQVDAAANQLRGSTTANRLVFTIGKFSLGDVFDTNRYAHDPRADFFNWSIIETGSFDYAADAWGYTYAAAGEWYQGAWTLRLGLANLSTVPNTTELETNLSQFQLLGEVEHRHTIAGHPGALRVTVFRNHGRFASLAEASAVAESTGTMPDLATLRRPANRWGGMLNAEQELTDTLGVFLRAGLTDGRYEAYDFTDIDRSLSFGLSLKGTHWGRAADTVGLAGVVNGASKARQRFLADGGLGILVGDGALAHPGNEWIGEAYYDWQPFSHFNLTADYQLVVNPGYNRDRGPASVLGLRAHLAY